MNPANIYIPPSARQGSKRANAIIGEAAARMVELVLDGMGIDADVDCTAFKDHFTLSAFERDYTVRSHESIDTEDAARCFASRVEAMGRAVAA